MVSDEECQAALRLRTLLVPVSGARWKCLWWKMRSVKLQYVEEHLKFQFLLLGGCVCGVR